MELYDIKENLNADNWDLYDNAISQGHQDKNWHIRLLREKCGYKAILLDTYWSPGEDNGHRIYSCRHTASTAFSLAIIKGKRS